MEGICEQLTILLLPVSHDTRRTKQGLPKASQIFRTLGPVRNGWITYGRRFMDSPDKRVAGVNKPTVSDSERLGAPFRKG